MWNVFLNKIINGFGFGFGMGVSMKFCSILFNQERVSKMRYIKGG